MSQTESQNRTIGGIETSSIPKSLHDRDQWVCWRLSGGRKPPIDPATGENAKINAPSTWTDLSTANSRYSNDSTVDGIGFVFTPDDPFVGMDIDDCRNAENGELSAVASDIVERFADKAYIEISPSSRGLHIIFRGEHTITQSQSGNIEIYDTKRYFTVTGNPHSKSTKKLYDCHSTLQSIYQNYVSNYESDNSNHGSTSTNQALPNLDYDEQLASVAEEALERFHDEAQPAADNIIKLLQGDSTGIDIPTKADNKTDRSAANHIALTQLLGVISMHSDLAEDDHIKAASALLTKYCKNHKFTECNQYRRWLTDRSQYRNYICNYAVNTFDILKFQQQYWSGTGTGWGTHSKLTGESVYFAIKLLPTTAYADDEDGIMRFVRDQAKHHHLNIKNLDQLVEYLLSYTPHNCLKVCTPPVGTHGSVSRAYPCADDVIDVVGNILTEKSPRYIKNVITSLQQNRRIKMAETGQYENRDYQYVYYPAQWWFPDPTNAESVRVGGSEYNPEDVPI